MEVHGLAMIPSQPLATVTLINEVVLWMCADVALLSCCAVDPTGSTAGTSTGAGGTWRPTCLNATVFFQMRQVSSVRITLHGCKCMTAHRQAMQQLQAMLDQE